MTTLTPAKQAALEGDLRHRAKLQRAKAMLSPELLALKYGLSRTAIYYGKDHPQQLINDMRDRNLINEELARYTRQNLARWHGVSMQTIDKYITLIATHQELPKTHETTLRVTQGHEAGIYEASRAAQANSRV